MQRITITNPNGAYIAFDHEGGAMYRPNGTEAAYEITEGTGILHPGKYYLTNFDGLSPEIKAYTVEGYQQNGTTFQNIFLGTRTIKIEAICCADIRGFYENTTRFFYDMRKRLFDICNPLSGELTLTYERTGGTTKQIKAYCSKMPQETENLGTARKYAFEFIATVPFWEATETTTLSIGDASGGFKMGDNYWRFTGSGLHFGITNHTQTADYEGTAPAGLTITCTTPTGCTNPQLNISDDNGSHIIGLNKTLSAGDTFIITTGYGAKNVTLNGQNAMRYLSSASEFIQLEAPGASFSTSATTGTVNFSVSYREQFITP